MPIKLRAYVAAIILLGTLFFIFTLNQAHEVDAVGLIVFAILSIIAESLVIVTQGQRALSVGFVIALAAVMVFGVPEAAWITSIGVMFRVVKHDGKVYHPFNFPIVKTLFNGADATISAGLAGLCYEALGAVPGTIDLNLSITAIIAVITAMVVYILVNAVIMSILMHFITGEKFFSNFINNMAWVVKDYLAMAPFAIIMALAYINYNVAGILIFFGPLLFARYSFKMYIDMRNIYIDTVKDGHYINGQKMTLIDEDLYSSDLGLLKFKEVQNKIIMSSESAITYVKVPLWQHRIIQMIIPIIFIIVTFIIFIRELIKKFSNKNNKYSFAFALNSFFQIVSFVILCLLMYKGIVTFSILKYAPYMKFLGWFIAALVISNIIIAIKNKKYKELLPAIWVLSGILFSAWMLFFHIL